MDAESNKLLDKLSQNLKSEYSEEEKINDLNALADYLTNKINKAMEEYISNMPELNTQQKGAMYLTVASNFVLFGIRKYIIEDKQSEFIEKLSQDLKELSKEK